LGFDFAAGADDDVDAEASCAESFLPWPLVFAAGTVDVDVDAEAVCAESEVCKAKNKTKSN
jgi:hypothetical protein